MKPAEEMRQLAMAAREYVSEKNIKYIYKQIEQDAASGKGFLNSGAVARINFSFNESTQTALKTKLTQDGFRITMTGKIIESVWW